METPTSAGTPTRKASDRGDRLTACLEVARLVAAALDLDALYLALHEQLRRVVDARGCALALYNGDGQEIDVPLRVSGGARQPPERWPWSSGVTEYVIRTRAPLFLPDRAWGRAVELGCLPRPPARPRSWIVAPVAMGDRVLGVLHVYNDERDFAFDELDASLLNALASHVAVALENARLFELVRSTEAQYRTLFRDLPVAVLALDEAGRIRSMNPAASRIFGRAEAELRARSLIDLAHPEQRQELEQLLAEAQGGSTPPRRDVRFLHPDGSERMTGLNLAPLEAEGGGTVLAAIRDVTDEDLLRRSLIQTEKMAAMGFLLSGIAHELNNPLAGIRAALQLVMDDAEPKHRELLQMALREADRASRIIQGVRDFGRKSAGRRERLCLNALGERVGELRAYALRNQNIELIARYDRGIPEVSADPEELLQAIMNLVQNAEHAVRAKPVGVRRITLTTRPRDGGVEFAVADTGPGIPAEIRERVFDPFFTSKAPGEGTGLGLTVVHAIVEGHGGRIELDETPGGGATVRLWLPPARPEPSAQPTSDTTVAASPAGLRVLMVEDESTIRDVMRRWCDRQKVGLTLATDGERALEAIRDAEFDVVLLDLRMPGMDGRTLFRTLERERPELAARVVFVTGDAVTGGTRDFLQRAGRPVLHKPFDLRTLAERLLEVAGRPSLAT